MQTEQSIQSWETLFEKCLQDLKGKFPKFSESQVAEEIGVPRSTLNRFYNESAKPNLENYLRVIKGSGNGHLLSKAMGLFDKDFEDVLEVSFKEQNAEMTTEALEKLFENRDVFVVYLLASHDSGVTSAQIKDVLGSRGLEALEVLLQKQLVVVISENVFRLAQGSKTLIRSFEGIKYHLDTYSKFYKTSHVGKKRNYVHSLTDGLNADGIVALQDAHRTFHGEVQKILRDDKYKGSTPMFSVAYCDSFTSINNQNTKEHWQ